MKMKNFGPEGEHVPRTPSPKVRHCVGLKALMVYSHCPRTRPRQILRPIKRAYIELYEDVHTHRDPVTDVIGHFISFGLGVGQCKHTITLTKTQTSRVNRSMF